MSDWKCPNCGKACYPGEGYPEYFHLKKSACCDVRIVRVSDAEKLRAELAESEKQKEEAVKCSHRELVRVKKDNMNLSVQLVEAIDVLTDAAQLIDGWNQGTDWTTWDQSVRDKISKVLNKFYDSINK
jgi:hypothetical protein